MRSNAVADHNTAPHQIPSKIHQGQFGQLAEERGADKGIRHLDSKSQLTTLLFHQLSESQQASPPNRRAQHHLGCEKITLSTLAAADACGRTW
jgi:Domain of unknown function (DUF4372)